MKKTIYYIMIGCLLLGTGCSDWLSVNPKDKVEQKEMFSDENGFKNALIGNYIMLKDSKLYGKTLTMEFCENLAQHWKTDPQATDGYTAAYDYKNAEVERLIEDIYGKFYNTIVNINNLLGYVDNGILTSDMHDLIKGEALAMRAFCHLDILRLFGPIPGEQTKDRILSYVRTVSKNYHEVNTWEEYVGYLEKDLQKITAQDFMQVVDDEMGEDYAKLAGLTAEEDLKEPLFESMKKRMPWLLILLALGMVVSSVVGMFETVVTQLPIIMCFQSLILDMAGNVGTQSLAVTIRVLMDESLTGKQKAELVFKEMRIGLCNGGLLGLMSFVLIGLYIFAIKGKTLAFSYAVSACIGVALLLAMLISSAVGTCIPLLFKKIKVDPAVASGPLITTINDLVAVVSYYGLSWLFLIEFFHMAG